MLSFKEELAKYECIMELDDIEQSIQNDELQDMLDILLKISKQNESREQSE